MGFEICAQYILRYLRSRPKYLIANLKIGFNKGELLISYNYIYKSTSQYRNV